MIYILLSTVVFLFISLRFSRACWYVMVVGLFSGLYNLSRFFEVTWYTWYDEFDRENKTGIMPTALRDNTLYIR